MSNQMLAEVHAILSAQAQAAGMVAYIDAYTLFQNSEAGPYVGLYNSRRNHREGRVYVNDFNGNGYSYEFRKLPQYIKDAVAASLSKEPAPEAPRSEGREYVANKGYLRTCQTFKIIRYKFATVEEGDNKEPWRIERCFPVGRAGQSAAEDAGPDEPQAPAEAQKPVNRQTGEIQPEPVPNRDDLVADLWNLFPGVYGKNWKDASDIIAAGVSLGRTKQLKDLEPAELCVVRAIVLLDQLGKQVYGQDWKAIRDGQVADMGYDSLFVMPVDKLRRLYLETKRAGEPVAESGRS